MKERGQGRPEGAPKEEDRAPQKEQGRGHKESAERQLLPGHGEVQGEPADLSVSSANTVDAESPEAGLNDNAPRKLRRRRSSSVGGGRLHGYGEDEIRK
jgi:hypothetical protein